ncbi:MAG: Fe-S cluster assembly protein SufD [Alphaproteobacteria bacterium]|nr:Fe-S cluster assembly protein SufD [Alphaproteobacteria bacterium]MCD8520052.1 Fe-S cluster assembly protein SufD [Alphaproteobacteria bacterium]MCD8526194.1 Fe-S cluster assembly protein SufD [Alphaproteobacteria bacterium]MCD8571227.1 Fe-S cluster assembly protein SufD [Alphaproteobacteria bacterium]
MKPLALTNLPTPKEERWKYTNLPRAMPADLQPVEAQNIVIHKTRGEICEEPVDILWTGLRNGIHTSTLKVTLEEGASLILIERCTGEGAYWMNAAAEFDLKDNARFVHIRIQEDSSEAVNTTMAEISLGRDAHYDSFTLNLGGKLTRHEIHAVLNGPGSEIHLNGLNLLKGKQHGDTTILIEHKAPHCQSNQFYRSILDDEARGVFQGKVYVHQQAQKTDGYQLSNALLLSPKAEMDTKPELEIYADDVKCSHGATTGQLDDDPLFYLRSRGLTEKEARLLLIQAFVDEVVDKIVDEDLKATVAAKSSDWLKSVL